MLILITGKTAILEIIDYCFFESKSIISEEKIGANVLWYGLKFNINDKKYTIARGEYKNSKELSSEYFFSATGDIPLKPTATISEKSLKEIIEKEFSINDSVSFPFGGKKIKKDSRISFRYFLLFNTQSGDVINHSKDYFDKMYDLRYQEALHRIFDLALSISTVENIILKGKIEELEKKIKRLEKEKEKIESSIENYDFQLKCIVKKAKESKIISDTLTDDNACIELLQDIIRTGKIPTLEIIENDKFQNLQDEKQRIEIKIRKLEQYKKSLGQYREILKMSANSLSPVNYVLQNFSSNISNEEYLQFLNILVDELEIIKQNIRCKQPFEYDVDDKIKELKLELKSICHEIDITPNVDDKEWDAPKRFIAVGELKSELRLLLNQNFDTTEIEAKIQKANDSLYEMTSKYIDISEKRKNTIKVLNEYIQVYIAISERALGEYGHYKSDFDYDEKVLRLRKPKATAPANITSSSDHLFMHLCLFLGMHQLIMDNNSPYILPFLILDQPSRPYFNNKKSDFDYRESQNNLDDINDWAKVEVIFTLLNKFMCNVLSDNKHFQIILLEHVSQDVWTNCEHIHLVDIFDGSNSALIPLDEIEL